MARINIEDSVFKDARFIDLCIALGSRIMAVGALTCLWVEAQKYYLSTGEIPHEQWLNAGLPDALITTGWAERCSTGVRARGQDTHFAWLRRASAAGKASQKVQKLKKSVEPPLNIVEPPLNGRASSYSSSSSKEETTTTTIKQNTIPVDLRGQLDEAWVAWNQTLTKFGLSPKNISPVDERTLAQAIRLLGLDRVKNALVGKGLETKQGNYDPVNTLSLEYCLSRNGKTGGSNHERLENLALANAHVEQNRLNHERAEYIARYGSGSLAEDSP